MPTPTFEIVKTHTVPSNTTNVSLTSISSSYTHLYITTNIKNTSGGAGMDYYMTFNGDTSANYAVTKAGFAPGGGKGSNRTNAASSMQLFYTVAGSSNNGWTVGHIWVPFYKNTTFTKNIHVRGTEPLAETGMSTGFWNSTSAINRIDISASSASSIGAGSTINIYGILKG